MKDSHIYLIHIRDCLARIKDYTVEGKQVFFEDLKTQDAVIRNLEIMSESVTKLPSQWTEAYPDMKWDEIRGLRNRLAHEYLNVNLKIIWDIIENDLPNF
ncbi:MAG: DUF86 domain-containing protein [Crocosphaera sp.]|nr:DUF86 domain-containing protein [Crocosphaera sp.]